MELRILIFALLSWRAMGKSYYYYSDKSATTEKYVDDFTKNANQTFLIDLGRYTEMQILLQDSGSSNLLEDQQSDLDRWCRKRFRKCLLNDNSRNPVCGRQKTQYWHSRPTYFNSMCELLLDNCRKGYRKWWLSKNKTCHVNTKNILRTKLLNVPIKPSRIKNQHSKKSTPSNLRRNGDDILSSRTRFGYNDNIFSSLFRIRKAMEPSKPLTPSSELQNLYEPNDMPYEEYENIEPIQEDIHEEDNSTSTTKVETTIGMTETLQATTANIRRERIRNILSLNSDFVRSGMNYNRHGSKRNRNTLGVPSLSQSKYVDKRFYLLNSQNNKPNYRANEKHGSWNNVLPSLPRHTSVEVFPVTTLSIMQEYKQLKLRDQVKLREQVEVNQFQHDLPPQPKKFNNYVNEPLTTVNQMTKPTQPNQLNYASFMTEQTTQDQINNVPRINQIQHEPQQQIIQSNVYFDHFKQAQEPLKDNPSDVSEDKIKYISNDKKDTLHNDIIVPHDKMSESDKPNTNDNNNDDNIVFDYLQLGNSPNPMPYVSIIAQNFNKNMLTDNNILESKDYPEQEMKHNNSDNFVAAEIIQHSTQRSENVEGNIENDSKETGTVETVPDKDKPQNIDHLRQGELHDYDLTNAYLSQTLSAPEIIREQNTQNYNYIDQIDSKESFNVPENHNEAYEPEMFPNIVGFGHKRSKNIEVRNNYLRSRIINNFNIQ